MRDSVESMIFSPDSKVFGMTYAEWTVKWWQWLLSVSRQTSPAIDISGMYASQNQFERNVWFLAGTFGGHLERTCTIPNGKAIFMPVINYECSLAGTPGISDEFELESKCKKEIDDIKDIRFQIDGLSIPDLSPYRVCSPLFDIYITENNILNISPGSTKMVTDGFWIFLKPLTIGRHSLISFGSCQSGKINVGTSYNLVVR